MPAPSTPTGLAFTDRYIGTDASSDGLTIDQIWFVALFTWDAASGWSNYRVRARLDGGAWHEVYSKGSSDDATVDFSGCRLTIGPGGVRRGGIGVVAGKTVDIQVRAEAIEGLSDWSDSISFTTPAEYPPDVPSANEGTFAMPKVTVTVESDENGATVTASDAGDYEIGYEFLFQPIGGLGVEESSWRSVAREYLFSLSSAAPTQDKLQRSTLYLVRVRAITGYESVASLPPAPGLEHPTIVGDWSDDVLFVTAPDLGLPAAANAYVGKEFSYSLNASENTETIETSALPAWLALDGNALTGTPVETGTHEITVNATNDAGESTGTLTIVVNAVGITLEFSAAGVEPWYSAAAALAVGITTVDQGAAFSVTVRGVALGPVSDSVTLSITSGPTWLKLSGLTLSGKAPEAGESDVIIHATNGTQTCDVTLHVVVRSLLSPGGDLGVFSSGLPNHIYGWKGETLMEIAGYGGDCNVEKWYLVGAPPGITLVDVEACEGSPYSEGEHRYTGIGGAPEQGGLWEATLIAQVCCTGISQLLRAPLRFSISGGLFLNWFHDDPSRRDMQIMLRTMDVFSQCFNDELWMKLGDRMRFYLIFRDGPLPAAPARAVVQDGISNVSPPEANFGREPASIDSITDVFFVVRLEEDPDQKVLFKIQGTATTIAGRGVFVFDFDVKGTELESAIEKAAKQTKRPAVQLDCLGEFSWKNAGRQESSLECFVTAYQDMA